MDLDIEFDVHLGIAHTRWATHGEPSPINSHPQRSDKNNGQCLPRDPQLLSSSWSLWESCCPSVSREGWLGTGSGFIQAVVLSPAAVKPQGLDSGSSHEECSQQ